MSGARRVDERWTRVDERWTGGEQSIPATSVPERDGAGGGEVAGTKKTKSSERRMADANSTCAAHDATPTKATGFESACDTTLPPSDSEVGSALPLPICGAHLSYFFLLLCRCIAFRH